MNYTDKIQKLIESKKPYKYNIEGKRVTEKTKAILRGLAHPVEVSVLAQDFGISPQRIYQIKNKYKI